MSDVIVFANTKALTHADCKGQKVVSNQNVIARNGTMFIFSRKNYSFAFAK